MHKNEEIDKVGKIDGKNIMPHATPLTERRCSACRGDTPLLADEELRTLYEELADGWRLLENRKLEKEFLFKDFKTALAFVDQVGALAEAEGHHPDLSLAWGKVIITLWTHKIDGLSINDFILAAKCDEAYQT